MAKTKQTKQQRPIVVNSINYKPDFSKGETTDKPSETQPNQALSMKQILQRYASGESLGGQTPIYHDDEQGEQEGIDFRTLDLVDIEERLEESTEIIKKAEKERKEAQAKKKKQLLQQEP